MTTIWRKINVIASSVPTTTARARIFPQRKKERNTLINTSKTITFKATLPIAARKSWAGATPIPKGTV